MPLCAVQYPSCSYTVVLNICTEFRRDVYLAVNITSTDIRQGMPGYTGLYLAISAASIIRGMLLNISGCERIGVWVPKMARQNGESSSISEYHDLYLTNVTGSTLLGAPDERQWARGPSSAHSTGRRAGLKCATGR